MKHKALGKGLRSLIPETPRRKSPEVPSAPLVDSPAPAAAAPRSVPQIDVDRIVPNRRQPREAFDDAALETLAQSIRSQGVLQPILVRPLEDGRFGLVAGERRWRAAQRAGLLKIPAVIREIPDEFLLEVALIENLQREELNPIEEARAYRSLLDDVGLTQQQIAERVGRQRATVANALRLLGLAEPVQRLLRSGELAAGHGRALAAIAGVSEQIGLATRVVKDGLSVRETEALVARLQRDQERMGTRPVMVRRDPNVVAAEEALQRALGSKVRIVQDRSGSGRIEIRFFSAEELDRLYETFLGRERSEAPPAQRKTLRKPPTETSAH